jgi:hypothetical protein
MFSGKRKKKKRTRRDMIPGRLFLFLAVMMSVLEETPPHTRGLEID